MATQIYYRTDHGPAACPECRAKLGYLAWRPLLVSPSPITNSHRSIERATASETALRHKDQTMKTHRHGCRFTAAHIVAGLLLAALTLLAPAIQAAGTLTFIPGELQRQVYTNVPGLQ